MAKIKVVGDAAFITSAVSLEDLKTVRKYRPETLVLKDDEGEPVFALSVKEGGDGSVGKYGITFTKEARDENGSAQITICCDFSGNSDEVRDKVVDLYGSALINLGRIEERIADAIDDINDERRAVERQVEVE